MERRIGCLAEDSEPTTLSTSVSHRHRLNPRFSPLLRLSNGFPATSGSDEINDANEVIEEEVEEEEEEEDVEYEEVEEEEEEELDPAKERERLKAIFRRLNSDPVDASKRSDAGVPDDIRDHPARAYRLCSKP